MGVSVKKMLLDVVSVFCTIALAGCATWPSDPGYTEVVDYQKIAMVDRWARINHTQVIWVSTPTRRVPVAAN